MEGATKRARLHVAYVCGYQNCVLAPITVCASNLPERFPQDCLALAHIHAVQLSACIIQEEHFERE